MEFTDPQQTVDVISSVGGVLGGLSMFMFMLPSGPMDALRRTAISLISSLMLSGLVSERLFGSTGQNEVMGVSFCIGFVAWSILGAVARYFDSNKEKNIVSMFKEVKNDGPANND